MITSPLLNMYPRALETANDTINKFPHEKWEADTPCEGWQAVHIVGHMIWAQELLSALARDAIWPIRLPDAADLLAIATADPVQAWQKARYRALRDLNGDALHQIVKAPVGEMPLGTLANVFGTIEMLVHSWDLATSAGRDVTLDPDLTASLLTIVTAHRDALRGPNLFGPPLDPPPDPSPQDALLAFLGRRVRR